MKTALFIGGTGTISSAITRRVAEDNDWKLYLLNRGTRNSVVPANVEVITADVNDTERVKEKISDMQFDCVCDFIGFTEEHVCRDYNLFRGKTKQYIYISSASAYQKPCRNYIITEQTPLENPYWEYSRNKIQCENFLFDKYRNDHFPVTIVRPSHTYDERSVPLGVHGNRGSWQVVKRMMEGKPVIIHGDGTSLWTMTHNTDFAKGFIGLMGNAAAVGEAFQIMSDETLTWNQIYQSIAEAVGVELKAVHIASEYLATEGRQYDFLGGLIGDKANSVVFDTSKLKRYVPSFHAEVSFKEGIKTTIDNILNRKDLQTADEEFDEWCDRITARFVR